MKTRKALLIGSLVAITLLVTQVNFIRGYNFLLDDTNDVLAYENGKLRSVSDYRDEIDIVSLDFIGFKLKLDLQATPWLNDSNHLYEVEIIWSTVDNYENKTEIKVGSINDLPHEDIITHTIVDGSGNPLPEQPSPIYGNTSIVGTQLVWSLDIFTNNPDVLFNPVGVNATAQYTVLDGEDAYLFLDSVFDYEIVVPGLNLTLNSVLSILGTLLVCGFAGYTLGSITVYFFTTNIRSKQTNTIFMAVFVVGLAVLVNFWFWLTPLQLIWNIGVFILAIIFGFMYATQGIMRLKFDSPLPDNLPIDTDENLGAVIILSKGESEDYNPLPLIRRFYRNKETGVEQRSKFMQPFTLFEEKRKYRKIIKAQESLTKDDIRLNVASNPYRRIVGEIKSKLEASFLDFDMYQEAYVNDWPTFNQALLSVISRGANKVTILNLFMAENYEYELAIQEMGKIDYSQIGVTISQTEFLAGNKDLQDILAKKIKSAASGEDLSQVGVLLIADGQPSEWDSLYPLTKQELKFQEIIKKKLVKLKFQKDKIAFAVLENRDPTIEDGIESLIAKGCTTIINAAITAPVDCLNTLYDIPVITSNLTKDQDIKLINVKAWNDAEEIVQLYLGLITAGKELPLAELGKDADIVLQQIGVGAKLAESEKQESSEDPEIEEEEVTLTDLNEMVESVESEDEEKE